MSDSTACSPLEEIAAFAEGQLRGAQRERMIAHLAACDDCREVFAGIVEVSADVREGEADVLVAGDAFSPAKRRFRWVAGAAAAAAVIAVVGVIAFSQLEARKHPPSRGAWLDQMPAAERLLPLVWGGAIMRGPEGEPDGGQLDKASTELGALMVDLDVTLHAGDAERSREVLRRMAVLLEHAPFADSDRAALLAIAAQPDVPSMKAAAASRLPALERRLGKQLDPLHLELGRFLNEARIAGLAGRQEFLGSAPARRYLGWLVSHRDALPARAHEQLLALQAASLPAAQAEAAESLLRSLAY
jgi:hypothetical protein